MNVLVIDAQGGGIGKQLVTAIKQNLPQLNVTAVGTNVSATAQMLKAGADNGATGENAVVVGARGADVIVGPIGIIIADSMLGEVTEKMATAVARSDAKKILIPFNNCQTFITGVKNASISEMIAETIQKLENLL